MVNGREEAEAISIPSEAQTTWSVGIITKKERKNKRRRRLMGMKKMRMNLI